MDYLGISVAVPEPEAFVLHKMIINSDRKDKMEKDQFDALREKLTKKEQKAVNTYLETIIQPMLEQDAALEKAKQSVMSKIEQSIS